MYLVYTAGPIRSKKGLYHIEQNIRRAEGVALELWRMGFAVLCPHANTRHFDGALIDGDETDFFKDADLWLKGDFEMLKRCDLIVMLPGWMDSKGATAEYEYALELRLPVFHWPGAKEELQMIGSGKIALKKNNTWKS